MSWRAFGVAALMTALVGCNVSPQPEPPSVKPSLDGSAVGFQKNVIVMGVAFEAPPGTVEPAEGEIVVINLDRTDPPVFAPVAPDGSFKLVLDGQPQAEFRFQVRTGSGRSEPVDLAGDSTGTVVGPVAHPLASCLTLAAALELELDGSSGAIERSVTVSNGCADALSFALPSFRTSHPGFSIAGGAQPFALEPGQDLSLSVRFDPGVAGAAEEISFVEVPAPERDRRPISLFGSD